MARLPTSKRREGRFGGIHRRAKRTPPHRTRRVGLEPLEPRMMLTAFASLEQGRFDVTTVLPVEGPAVAEIIQAGHLQGGAFQNTYGVDSEGRSLIRYVGATLLTGFRKVDGMISIGVLGPGEERDALVLGYALDGFIERQENDTAITHFTSGKAGFFTSTTFERMDPTTWDSIDGVFDDPLITWALSPPQRIVPGEGEQLADIHQEAVNRSGTNSNAAIQAQGELLFREEEDPQYTVTTPDQEGFLDVTTGWGQFDPDLPIYEGMFLSTAQTTAMRFISGVKTGARTELNNDQHAVLEALARFAFENADNEIDNPVGERNGVKYYFATSINDPDDALQGYYVVPSSAASIRSFDGFTGGDLFQNQDDVLLHPTLQGFLPRDLIVISPDKGNQSTPYIHLVEQETGELVHRFLAYHESYLGGVRVATADLTGDGIDEIITAPGRAHRPLVRVFNQQGQLLTEFLAFDPAFTSGIDVAVGDVTGNGYHDIVVGMSLHGSKVQVFENLGGLSFSPYKNAFEAFPGFLGGVTVQVADMGAFSNGTILADNIPDGRKEIIVGNEAGMASTVHIFDTSGATASIVGTFYPFSCDPWFYHQFLGGVSLDLARVNTDLIPDLIVGAGNRGGSRVQVLNGSDRAPSGTGATTITPTFRAYSDTETNSYNAPVRVTAVDTTKDGKADRITVAQGSDGSTRKIRSFDALTADLVDEFFENNPSGYPDFGGAYFVTALEQPDPTWVVTENASGEAPPETFLSATSPSSSHMIEPDAVIRSSTFVPITLTQWRATRFAVPPIQQQIASQRSALSGGEYTVERSGDRSQEDKSMIWLRRRGGLLNGPQPTVPTQFAWNPSTLP